MDYGYCMQSAISLLHHPQTSSSMVDRCIEQCCCFVLVHHPARMVAAFQKSTEKRTKALTFAFAMQFICWTFSMWLQNILDVALQFSVAFKLAKYLNENEFQKECTCYLFVHSKRYVSFIPHALWLLRIPFSGKNKFSAIVLFMQYKIHSLLVLFFFFFIFSHSGWWFCSDRLTIYFHLLAKNRMVCIKYTLRYYST